MHFDPYPSVELQFGGDEEGVTLTTNDMLAIYEFVSCNVLPRFARFFPKREARADGGIEKVLIKGKRR